jgi:hypothetical protein
MTVAALKARIRLAPRATGFDVGDCLVDGFERPHLTDHVSLASLMQVEYLARASDLRVVDDPSTQVAALLQEASETHHRVYRIVDGDDPDWASWYANWLLNLSELPQLLEVTPVRSELVWILVSLDKQYNEIEPELAWPQWYSERIVQHFARESG